MPGPGGSNLLSYVYRLGSSAAAHLDYITLRATISLIKEWNDDINTIILYDVSGRKAAEFIDKDNLDWLPNGLYIAEIRWKERPSTRARVHITR